MSVLKPRKVKWPPRSHCFLAENHCWEPVIQVSRPFIQSFFPLQTFPSFHPCPVMRQIPCRPWLLHCGWEAREYMWHVGVSSQLCPQVRPHAPEQPWTPSTSLRLHQTVQSKLQPLPPDHRCNLPMVLLPLPMPFATRDPEGWSHKQIVSCHSPTLGLLG